MTNLTITYFVHGTTIDNESGIATGWLPGELSPLGVNQCRELKRLVSGNKFDAVISSDLRRAVDSAKIASENFELHQDARLRECNYGDFNGRNSALIDSMAKKCIANPFPNGESYTQVEFRVRSLLKDLRISYSGRNVAFVAHKYHECHVIDYLSSESAR